MTERSEELFDEDLAELGFVMNLSRLWAYQPEALAMLFSLMSQVSSARPLGSGNGASSWPRAPRHFGDSYCSLAWGTKLAEKTDAQLAAGVLAGDDSVLTEAERAMGLGAPGQRDPNGTSTEDLQGCGTRASPMPISSP